MGCASASAAHWYILSGWEHNIDCQKEIPQRIDEMKTNDAINLPAKVVYFLCFFLMGNAIFFPHELRGSYIPISITYEHGQHFPFVL